MTGSTRSTYSGSKRTVKTKRATKRRQKPFEQVRQELLAQEAKRDRSPPPDELEEAVVDTRKKINGRQPPFVVVDSVTCHERIGDLVGVTVELRASKWLVASDIKSILRQGIHAKILSNEPTED